MQLFVVASLLQSALHHALRHLAHLAGARGGAGFHRLDQAAKLVEGERHGGGCQPAAGPATSRMLVGRVRLAMSSPSGGGQDA